MQYMTTDEGFYFIFPYFDREGVDKDLLIILELSNNRSLRINTSIQDLV